MENQELIKLAIKVADNSYSPYSEYKVGAALLTKSGKVYLGANVENASYPATNCAERTALFNAISNGEREFEKIAIVGGVNGDFKEFCSPCGICRQVMSEFCERDFQIILGNKMLEYKEYNIDELLPLSFKL